MDPQLVTNQSEESVRSHSSKASSGNETGLLAHWRSLSRTVWFEIKAEVQKMNVKQNLISFFPLWSAAVFPAQFIILPQAL